jgi:signal transduction histidine kinase
VVTNLIMNARYAIGSGGRIQVRTGHRGNRVVLSVVDNGCGMSPAFIVAHRCRSMRFCAGRPFLWC